jgi:hypothetical protein
MVFLLSSCLRAAHAHARGALDPQYVKIEVAIESVYQYGRSDSNARGQFVLGQVIAKDNVGQRVAALPNEPRDHWLNARVRGSRKFTAKRNRRGSTSAPSSRRSVSGFIVREACSR